MWSFLFLKAGKGKLSGFVAGPGPFQQYIHMQNLIVGVIGQAIDAAHNLMCASDLAQ